MVNLADRGKGKTQLLTDPGVYTLLEAEASFPIKVVTDIAESNLQQADAAELRRWQYNADEANSSKRTPAKEPDATDSDASDQGAASANSTDVLRSESAPTSGAGKDAALLSLTRWLLPAALFLLLLETLYANWHLRARRT